jgi:hypothetical protein
VVASLAAAFVPAKQDAHDADPASAAKWPGEQIVQIVEPLAANFPAGHFAQAPASVYSPSSQPHDGEPAAANFPTGQASQDALPWDDVFPAGHARHLDKFANVVGAPLTHALHAAARKYSPVFVVGQYRPASHSVHLPYVGGAKTVPAWQSEQIRGPVLLQRAGAHDFAYT